MFNLVIAVVKCSQLFLPSDMKVIFRELEVLWLLQVCPRAGVRQESGGQN